MTGPPQFNLLQAIVTFLFGDALSFKSVILRIVVMAASLISYMVITYSSDIVAYFREVPKEKVINEIIQKREDNYPKMALERATMLYNTIEPDCVIVLGYKPQFTNEYIYVITSVGKNFTWGTLSVDKASSMYRLNLLGEGYLAKVEQTSIAKEQQFVFPSHLLEDAKYVFSYPIFDLDNSYSGAIVVLWKNQPKDYATSEFSRRMRLIVLPSARALGRAKWWFTEPRLIAIIVT